MRHNEKPRRRLALPHSCVGGRTGTQVDGRNFLQFVSSFGINPVTETVRRLPLSQKETQDDGSQRNHNPFTQDG